MYFTIGFFVIFCSCIEQFTISFNYVLRTKTHTWLISLHLSASAQICSTLRTEWKERIINQFIWTEPATARVYLPSFFLSCNIPVVYIIWCKGRSSRTQLNIECSIYWTYRLYVSALSLSHRQVSRGVPEETIQYIVDNEISLVV